jgi:hypothetical protein
MLYEIADCAGHSHYFNPEHISWIDGSEETQLTIHVGHYMIYVSPEEFQSKLGHLIALPPSKR